MVGKLALVILTITLSSARSEDNPVYRLCAEVGRTQECQSIESGSSKVGCTPVTDSVECLMRMERDQADFGVFSSEETILAALSQPEKYNVIASVRNQDKLEKKFAFHSVALVRSSHVGGIKGLQGAGFCHPGYSKAKEQLWSNRVLKYFERKVAMTSPKCDSKSTSSAEDDAHELTKFFGAACRPGPWVMDPIEDEKLKKSFPTLCSLCTSDGMADCSRYRHFEPYSTTAPINSHLSAIQCVVNNNKAVAYVAYDHVVEFFKQNVAPVSDYALLCENGTTVPLSSTLIHTDEPPCSWIKQPWGALIARKEKASSLLSDFKDKWMPDGRSGDGEKWIDSLDSLLFKHRNEILHYEEFEINPATHVQEGRPLPVSEKACHDKIKWCTTNEQEQSKCEWVSKTALTIGLSPEVSCVRRDSPIDCLSTIKQSGADFISIDSNLGYIARKFYDNDVILYHETSRQLTSKVLTLIKEMNKDDITRFEQLRDKNACFPEYAGIAWIAFIRAAHERKVINPSECDYAYEVGNFFRGACAPGATDPSHFPSKAVDASKLCAACKGFSPRGMINEQGVVSSRRIDVEECPANSNNKFYGSKGALRCLMEPDSNVAFIEGQYLEQYLSEFDNVRPTDFRVLCRNGSLASYPGVKVDDNCALSVTVDSEVVGRRSSKQLLSIQLFLQELDAWFGYNSGSTKLINFEVFSEFDKTKNLLFKDSTIALATSDSKNEYVQNYAELFKHVDSCVRNSAVNIVSSILLTFISVVILQIIKH